MLLVSDGSGGHRLVVRLKDQDRLDRRHLFVFSDQLDFTAAAGGGDEQEKEEPEGEQLRAVRG